MICPYCGTHIDDASLVCPACHAELQKTVMMPRLEATYCKSCGALVPQGQVRCPICGLPVETALQRAASHSANPSHANLSPEDAALNSLAPQPETSQGRHFKIQLPSPEDDPLTTAQFEAQIPFASQSADKNQELESFSRPLDLPSLTQVFQQLEEDSDPESASSTAPDATPKVDSVVDPDAKVQAIHQAELEAAPEDESLEETTSSIPRIESAIPSLSTNGYSNERLPHLRAVIFTAAVALFVVGGSALMIAHPWDPGAFQSHNTQAFDTSKAGFPGEVTKLKGQDSTGDAATVVSGDQASYNQLNDAYEQLKSLHDTLDSEQNAFEDVAFDSQTSDLKKHADAVDDASYKISNLIDTISKVDTTSGTYVDTKKNLITLGNWLRNWCETLDDSYQAALKSSNPTGDKSEISSALRAAQDASGKNTYQAYFEKNFDAWKPQAPQA